MSSSGKNARNDTLVSVASGHLVADGKLALHGDEDLHHLDHARSKFVALTQLGDLLFVDVRENLDLPLGAIFVFLDFRADIHTRRSHLHFAQDLRLRLPSASRE